MDYFNGQQVKTGPWGSHVLVETQQIDFYLFLMLSAGHCVPPNAEELLLYSDELPMLHSRQFLYHGGIDICGVGMHTLLNTKRVC